MRRRGIERERARSATVPVVSTHYSFDLDDLARVLGEFLLGSFEVFLEKVERDF